MPKGWSIIVHGGAKSIALERRQAHRDGCLAAVVAGQGLLEAGRTAVEAAVAAIRVLEDDPTFNAGYGCVLNADGEVELDAALMDGATLDVGAVCALHQVKNPILVCEAMLHDQPVLLAGEGGLRYAREHGLELCPRNAHIQRVAEPCDTVGAVVMDASGDIAAATSTGGLSGVRPGRVGDSPIPGCGLYAENGLGGVSFSGDGESILRLALAARVMHDLRLFRSERAAQRAVEQMKRVGGEAGAIVIDKRGRPAFAHNSEHFAVAFATSAKPAESFLQAKERTRG